MQQVVVSRHGGPGVLKLETAADPAPGIGEIVIDVAAAGVNFADILGRLGCYPDAPRPPFVPGFEVAGRISGLGGGVEAFRLGDRVAAMTLFGGYASKIKVTTERVIALPDGVRFEEGAAVPVVYLTAQMLLGSFGCCRPGETVLVESAAGGLGMACIDLAGLMGLNVVASCSRGKVPALQAAGVAAIVVAEDPSARARILEFTGGRGVDLAVTSRAGPHWGRLLQVLAPGGRLAVVGARPALKPPWTTITLLRDIALTPWWRTHPFALMQANKAIFGLNLYRLALSAPQLVERARDAVAARWRDGKLRPTIDSTFPLGAAGAAQERLSRRQNVGKVVLTV